MYLVVIAWVYVVLMMVVAEATATNGTVLGAAITFVLYGLVPVSIVAYIMGTPGRKRAIKAREVAEQEAARDAAHTSETSSQPDAGGEAPADAVTTVRKEL
jgi:hypothetical protein